MKLQIAPGLASDLNALVDTRVLVQANSGGGKSWCLRRLLEQTHGHVQHLVLDTNGGGLLPLAQALKRGIYVRPWDYPHIRRDGSKELVA